MCVRRLGRPLNEFPEFGNRFRAQIDQYRNQLPRLNADFQALRMHFAEDEDEEGEDEDEDDEDNDEDDPGGASGDDPGSSDDDDGDESDGGGENIRPAQALALRMPNGYDDGTSSESESESSSDGSNSSFSRDDDDNKIQSESGTADNRPVNDMEASSATSEDHLSFYRRVFLTMTPSKLGALDCMTAADKKFKEHVEQNRRTLPARPMKYFVDLVMHSFLDGAEIMSLSTLEHKWMPQASDWLSRRFPRLRKVPSNSDIRKNKRFKEVVGVIKTFTQKNSKPMSSPPLYLADLRNLLKVCDFSLKGLTMRALLWVSRCTLMRCIDLVRLKWGMVDLSKAVVDATEVDMNLNASGGDDTDGFFSSASPGTVRVSNHKVKKIIGRVCLCREAVEALSLLYDRLGGESVVEEESEIFRICLREFDSTLFGGTTKKSSVLDYVRGSTDDYNLQVIGLYYLITRLCRDAGYPDKYFTGHSLASGVVTEEVIQKYIDGEGIEEAFDDVIFRSGRWTVKSGVIRKYVSFHTHYILSALRPFEKGQARRDAYLRMKPHEIHNIKIGIPYASHPGRRWDRVGHVSRYTETLAAAAKCLGVNVPRRSGMTRELERKIIKKVATVIYSRGVGMKHPVDDRSQLLNTLYKSFCDHNGFRKVSSKVQLLMVRRKVERLVPHFLLMGVLQTAPRSKTVTVNLPLPESMLDFVALHTMHELKIMYPGGVPVGTRLDLDINVIDASELYRKGMSESDLDRAVDLCCRFTKRLQRPRTVTIVRDRVGREKVIRVPKKHKEGFKILRMKNLQKKGKHSGLKSPQKKEIGEDFIHPLDIETRKSSSSDVVREEVRGIRKRKRWTQEEINALKQIYRVVDRDSSTIWADIKQYDNNHDELLADRTNVDLKDKWRNMLKDGSVRLH